MAAALRRVTWCTTCGDYVRAGTHNTRVPHYGRGPEHPLPFQHRGVSNARALLICAGALAVAALALVFVMAGIFAFVDRRL